MPIERVRGFYESKELSGAKRSIGIESGRIAECVRELKRRKADGVFGSAAFGFRERDLAFLSDLPRIRLVHFWWVDLLDVEGVYAAEDAVRIHILGKRKPIDGSRLGRRLRSLSLTWNAKDQACADLDVEDLFLRSVNPRSRSLDAVQIPARVQRLEICLSNISDLQAMPRLERLRELQLSHCRDLTSVAGIHERAPNLEKLIIGACNKLTHIGDIRRLKRLRFLSGQIEERLEWSAPG